MGATGCEIPTKANKSYRNPTARSRDKARALCDCKGNIAHGDATGREGVRISKKMLATAHAHRSESDILFSGGKVRPVAKTDFGEIIIF